jgi:hypothetical protein
MSEGDHAEREAILAELTAVDPDFQGDLEPEPDCGPPDETEYDAEERDDLQLAQILLTGFHDRTEPESKPKKAAARNDEAEDEPEVPLPQKKYLKPSEEFVGRKAIARLLRSGKPVDRTILLRLAALFDPETETAPFSSFECEPIERRLIFGPRHNGRRTTAAMGRIEIALAFKAALLLESRDGALNTIATKYGLTTRSVETAVAYYKSVVGR